MKRKRAATRQETTIAIASVSEGSQATTTRKRATKRAKVITATTPTVTKPIVAPPLPTAPFVEPRRIDPVVHLPTDLLHVCLLPLLNTADLLSFRTAARSWRTEIDTYLLRGFPKREFSSSWLAAPRETPLALSDFLGYCAIKSQHPTERMAKTNIQKLFRLTPTQCSGLSAVIRPNPHSRNAAPMQLVSIRDAFYAAVERHGNLAGVKTYSKRLQTQKQQRGAQVLNKSRARRQELEEALAAQGLELRADSQVCAQWLEHPTAAKKEGWTLASVVRHSCELRFLFDHTPAFLQAMNEWREQKNDDRQHLQNNWHDRDAHEDFHDRWDDFDFVQAARRRVTVQFPAVWPWLH